MINPQAYQRGIRGFLAIAALLLPFCAPAQAVSATFHGRALIVGVNHYDDSDIMSLHYSVADAKLLAGVLDDPTRGIFDKGDVRMLTDDAPDADHKATRLNILKGVQWLSGADPGDTILLYFSGHGAVDDEGKQFLVSEDAQLSALSFTAVPVEDVNNILDDSKKTKARQIVVIFDSCHSGVRRGAKDIESESSQVIDAMMTQAEGRVTLSSCNADEQSFEDPDWGHGVFTYNLVQGLMGAADANGDGLITAGELHVYTRKAVSEWAAAHQVRQTPRVESNVSGDIVLARDPAKWAAALASKAAARAEITEIRSKIEQRIGVPGELNAADGGLVLAALDRLASGTPADTDKHVFDLARSYTGGSLKSAAFSAELVALRPASAAPQATAEAAPIKLQIFQPKLDPVGDDEYNLDCDAGATVKVVGLADSSAGMTKILLDGDVLSTSSLGSRDLQLVGATKPESGLRFEGEIHAGNAPLTSVITAVDAAGQRRLIQVHLHPRAGIVGSSHETPTVAIIGLARKGIDEYPELRSMRIGQGVQQILTRAASDTGKFTLVEEKSEVIDSLVKMQWQERSAAFDQSQAVEVGKLLGARYVVYGQVYDFASPSENRGKLYMAVEVRMVDVQTARYIPGYGEATLVVPKDDKGEADFDRSTLAQVSDTAIRAALADLFKRVGGDTRSSAATGGQNN
jgi:uncharacterized caspase-like protein